MSDEKPVRLVSESSPIVPIIRPDGSVALPKDENDVQIKPLSDGHKIVEELRSREDIQPGTCPHRGDPAHCALCRPMEFDHVVTVPAAPDNDHLKRNVQNWVRQDRQARQQAQRLQPVVPPGSSSHDKSYREILGLEREKLLEFLNAVIGTESHPAEEAVWKRQASIRNEIERLEKVIDEQNVIIGRQSAAWQKRNGWEVRPAQVRERYKREARTEIKKCQARILTLQHRLDDWTTDPAKLTDEEKIDRSIRKDVHLRDRLRSPEEFAEYEAFVNLTGPLPSFIDTLRQWENAVILQAVRYQLYTPPADLARLCPGLNRHRLSTQRQDDTAEDALIFKTDGEQIGGHIYGNGRRDDGRRRQLDSFDKPVEHGWRDRHTQPDGGTWTHDLDSGDLNGE